MNIESPMDRHMIAMNQFLDSTCIPDLNPDPPTQGCGTDSEHVTARVTWMMSPRFRFHRTSFFSIEASIHHGPANTLVALNTVSLRESS